MSKQIIIGAAGAIVATLVIVGLSRFTDWFTSILRPDIPARAVVSFNLEECPEQWQVYERAYGRFVRGIDPREEKNIDPDGARSPGEHQEDAIQEHHHTRRYHESGKRAGGEHPDFEYQTPKGNKVFATTQITDARVSEETRPKNVSLLYCEKVR